MLLDQWISWSAMETAEHTEREGCGSIGLKISECRRRRCLVSFFIFLCLSDGYKGGYEGFSMALYSPRLFSCFLLAASVFFEGSHNSIKFDRPIYIHTQASITASQKAFPPRFHFSYFSHFLLQRYRFWGKKKRRNISIRLLPACVNMCTIVHRHICTEPGTTRI